MPTNRLLAVILVFFLPMVARSDIPKCNSANPDFSKSPYCLPDEYNKDLIPPQSGQPLHIDVDIMVFEVSKIDDITLSLTFELYFDLKWKETRLIINDSSPEWSVDGVMGSTNFVRDLWLPDIQIANLKQFQRRNIITDVAGLIFFQNRDILYTVSTEAVISCPMKFNAYPLDYQECTFHVGSYIHDNTQIFFTGHTTHDFENQRAQQYTINITALDPQETYIMWANRNYSQTGFKINLIRRRTPVLLQTYLPSGLFVVVSWISFIVPPEIVPGRMALLVTLFLVLVNIFNSVTANAPKAEGLTAVETWVVMCILHVFMVLAEYAFILRVIQMEKRKGDAARRTTLGKSVKAVVAANQLTRGNNTSSSHRVHRVGERSGGSTPFEQIFETDPDYLATFSSNPHIYDYHPQQQQLQQQHRTSPPGMARHNSLNHRCNHVAAPPAPSVAVVAAAAAAVSSSRQPNAIPMNSLLSRRSSFAEGENDQNGAPLSDNWNGNNGNGRKVDTAVFATSSVASGGTPRYRGCRGGSSRGGSSDNHRGAGGMMSQKQTGLFGSQEEYGAIHLGRLQASAIRCDRVDRVSLVLFPLMFFLVNVMYWSYYLFLNDVIEDMW